MSGRPGVAQFRGALLRAARAAAVPPMTQDKLEEISGVHHVNIAQLEAGSRRPQPNVLRALALALAIAPVRLCELSPEPSLAELRECAGYLQEELAGRAGIGRAAYAMIESGRTVRLKPQTIEALAVALDVAAEQIETAHRRDVERALAKTGDRKETGQ